MAKKASFKEETTGVAPDVPVEAVATDAVITEAPLTQAPMATPLPGEIAKPEAEMSLRAPVEAVKPGVRKISLQQARAMHAAKHLSGV